MQSSNNLSSSMLAGSLTLFAVGAGVAIYSSYNRKQKLSFFLKQLHMSDSDTLEEHYFSGFTKLINKQDPFFSRWTIECIGGANNKVYKVSEGEGASKLELAVFRVFHQDESVECCQKIKQLNLGRHVSHQHALIPISYSNRQKGIVATYLEVSEYLPQGNMESQALKFTGSIQERQDQTLEYLISIINMLLALQKAGIFFSDLKTSNLFINYRDEIVLADTKTLVLAGTDERENYNKPLAVSPAYLPPESFSGDTRGTAYNLDALQSYQLGLSIYEYLTNDFEAKKNRNQHYEPGFKFDHPAFKGEKGSLLKAIILDLVAINPKNRFTISSLKEKYSLEDRLHEKNAIRHNDIFKEYSKILNAVNKSRLDATIALCRFKDLCYLDDNDDLVYRETSQRVNLVVADEYMNNLIKKISLHHEYKNQLLDLALNYQAFPKDEKVYYWSCYVTLEQAIEIVNAFDDLCNQFFKNGKNNFLMSDLFQALHMPHGRAILLKMVELLSINNKSISLVNGNAIQVNYSVLDNNDKKILSASYDVQSLPSALTISEFNQLLESSKKLGNPNAIQSMTLQYPNSWSVAFADTYNSFKRHDYYLLDTCGTLLHEVGHVNALLTGEFVVSSHYNVLPSNLFFYHELEEYLNIEKRDNAESKTDPIGLKRIGHTGVEFASLNMLTLERVSESLLSSRIISAREKMVREYVQASATNKIANDSVMAQSQNHDNNGQSSRQVINKW